MAISQREAALQVGRFQQMIGYPNGEAALKDLVVEMMKCEDQEQAILIVAHFKDTATSDTRCPSSGDISRAIYDLQKTRREALSKCVACGGTGSVLVPILVTYRGGFVVKHIEPLRGETETGLAAFNKRLVDTDGSGGTQIILSAAERCPCRKFGRPVLREESDCRRCKGDGFYGGQIGTSFDGPWKWCDCLAGVEKKNAEPGLVDEANAAREKLLNLGAKRLGFRNARGQSENVRSILEHIG